MKHCMLLNCCWEEIHCQPEHNRASPFGCGAAGSRSEAQQESYTVVWLPALSTQAHNLMKGNQKPLRKVLFNLFFQIGEKAWASRGGCFQTVVLEKTLESLLDCKEIQPAHPKGNQP